MVDFAYAMAQAPNGGSGAVMTQLLFFAAIFAIFYFLLIRPQQKQKKDREAMLSAVKKGDPLQAARLAGIMAAKQTSALIPLCHPLPLSSVQVDLTPIARGYAIQARVRTTAQTGVEMEALTAVAVAALTIYDMVKAVDRSMVIGDVRLMFKSGGRSGTYRRM